MIDVVRAPEGGELAEQVGLLVVVLGRTEPVDRVWTARFADLQHLVADLVDRLFPGNLLPFAVDQLGRMLQAPLAMRMLAHRGTLGAVRAQVKGAVPARLLTGPDAVLHLGNDRAANRAVGTNRLLENRARLRVGRRSLRLPYAPERQGRRGGDTTGGQPRAFQEGTAVNRATGGTGKRF